MGPLRIQPRLTPFLTVFSVRHHHQQRIAKGTRWFSTSHVVHAQAQAGAGGRPGTFPGYAKAAIVLGAGLALTAAVFGTSTRPSPSPSAPAKATSTSSVPIHDPPSPSSSTPAGEHQVSTEVESLAHELRLALGLAEDDERVSTDADVLHVHGWSDNDYHPGASSPPSSNVFPFLLPASRAILPRLLHSLSL